MSYLSMNATDKSVTDETATTMSPASGSNAKGENEMSENRTEQVLEMNENKTTLPVNHTRKSRRVADDWFVFNIENMRNCKDKGEIFDDVKDLVLYFVKSFNGIELMNYLRTVNYKDGSGSYQTLRIPKATVNASYEKLKQYMASWKPSKA